MSQILSKKIIAWYQKHQRKLPWRVYKSSSDRDYRVLLSEIMLQQTKVSTVIPYFNKFYKKFSTIKSLSKSRITSVLKLWQGLGYYQRARNLHQIAKIVSQKFGGKLPDSFSDLKNLPGIGDYTASAILSIAKNKPFIGIDGNVKRVISRIFFINYDSKLILNIEKKLNLMKVKIGSSDLMQGLMELGALICLVKEPMCKLCPLKADCISYKKNMFVLKNKTRTVVKKYFYALYAQKGSRILFTLNNKFKFLSGLINLPLIESKNKNYKTIIKKNFKKVIIENIIDNSFNYRMSNFIMYIKILRTKKIIFDKKKYFWLDKKKLKNFTVSILTQKLLQFASKYEQ